jgi:hypothetical protein
LTTRIETPLGTIEIVDETNEPEGNKRLIAAAPELLAVLKALASTARTFRNVPQNVQEWTSIDEGALVAAFAAIAKATNPPATNE